MDEVLEQYFSTEQSSNQDVMSLNDEIKVQRMVIKEVLSARSGKTLQLQLDTNDYSLPLLLENMQPLPLHLNLSGSQLYSIRNIGDYLAQLQTLCVDNCNLDSLDGIWIAQRLTVLRAANNQIQDLDYLQGMDTLTQIDLRGNDINDVRQIQFLQQCNRMTHLNLQENPVTQQPSYMHNIKDALPALQYLDDHKISIDHSKSLSQAGRNTAATLLSQSSLSSPSKSPDVHKSLQSPRQLQPLTRIKSMYSSQKSPQALEQQHCAESSPADVFQSPALSFSSLICDTASEYDTSATCAVCGISINIPSTALKHVQDIAAVYPDLVNITQTTEFHTPQSLSPQKRHVSPLTPTNKRTLSPASTSTILRHTIGLDALSQQRSLHGHHVPHDEAYSAYSSPEKQQLSTGQLPGTSQGELFGRRGGFQAQLFEGQEPQWASGGQVVVESWLSGRKLSGDGSPCRDSKAAYNEMKYGMRPMSAGSGELLMQKQRRGVNRGSNLGLYWRKHTIALNACQDSSPDSTPHNEPVQASEGNESSCVQGGDLVQGGGGGGSAARMLRSRLKSGGQTSPRVRTALSDVCSALGTVDNIKHDDNCNWYKRENQEEYGDGDNMLSTASRVDASFQNENRPLTAGSVHSGSLLPETFVADKQETKGNEQDYMQDKLHAMIELAAKWNVCQ